MPSTDPDKIYVKKFKINDLLNDLYSELTKNKPDDPVEYAYKYFEAKMPPPPKPRAGGLATIPFDIESAGGSRKASIAGSGSGADPAIGQGLFAKLFNPKNLLGDKTNLMEDKQLADVSSARLSSAGFPADSSAKGLQPFFELNLINQIQRKLVAKSKELTEDEILEREMVQFYNKEGDSSEEDSNENRQKIITYKSQLKTRDLADRHKQELKELILKERSKVDAPDHRETDREREKKKSKELRIKGLEMEMEQENELSDEILVPNRINRSSEVQSARAALSNIILRDLSAQQNSSIYHRQHLSSRTSSMLPPGVQYVICQLCKKIQNADPSSESRPQADENRHNFRPLSAASESERINNEAKVMIPPLIDRVKEAVENKLSIFDLLTSKPANKDPRNDTFDDENIESASQVSGPRPIAPFEATTNRSASDKPSDKHYDGDILSWVMNNQKMGTTLAPPEVPSLGLDSSASNKETIHNIQSPPSSARRPSSRTGSKVSSRVSNTSRSSHQSNTTRPSDAAAGNNNELRWTMKNSSSEVSTLVNKDAAGKKK